MALDIVLRLGVVVGGCAAMRGRWATALLISDAFFRPLTAIHYPCMFLDTSLHPFVSSLSI